MAGNLDPKELETLVRQDEIDTVLTVFPDVQGRLMGKRVVGRYFLEHVAAEGVHACAYLLTVDVDMEPLPGYKFASWATGYQDVNAVPDLSTLRRVPWLPKTALVFCDVYTEEGEPVEVSPRRILRRQLERAAKAGYRVMVGSELELYLFKESFAEARAKRYHDLTPVSQYLEDTTSSRRPRRRDSSGPSGTGWRAPRCRWSSPRASGGAARRRSTSATPRRWRWRTATPSTSTG